MQKKIIGVAIMAAIAVTAGWNISQKSEVSLSDLTLSNVEALAQGEMYPGPERIDHYAGQRVCVGHGYLFCI